MITPGLLRRALVRGLQWRFIVLQLFLLLIAGLVFALPFAGFFDKYLGHLPGSDALAAHLGSGRIIDLLHRFGASDSSHPENSLNGAIFVALLLAPIFVGAVLAAARSDEQLGSRQLLEGAGSYYGRLLRAAFASLIPIAICGALASILFVHAGKVSSHATTHAAADRASNIALAVGIFFFVVATLWIDATRALFVAQPLRRSAFFATFAGIWLVLRRPLRSLLIGLVTMVLGLSIAALFMVLRQQIVQSSGGKILLAFLLSEIALAALAWSHAARLFAFVELARADVLARLKPAGTFEMAPPKTSPPPAVEPTPPALESIPPATSFVLEMPASSPPPAAPPASLGEIVVERTVSVAVISEVPPPPTASIEPIVPAPIQIPDSHGLGTGSA